VAQRLPASNHIHRVTSPLTHMEHPPDTAFSWCPELRQVSWPRGLKTIGKACFQCTGLPGVDLTMAELVSVRSSAFMGCPPLTYIAFPASLCHLQRYPMGSYIDCSGMACLDASATGLVRMGRRAFWCCWSLKETCLPRAFGSAGFQRFGSGPVRSLQLHPSRVPMWRHDLADAWFGLRRLVFIGAMSVSSFTLSSIHCLSSRVTGLGCCPSRPLHAAV
jgi:hypothetical protein